MSILQRYDSPDGIEILINTETGESFCSVRGYARMAGKDESTIRERIKKGAGKCASETAEILTAGGIQVARLINEDLIAEWLPKDNPSAATSLLKLGVRVVLHNMAGYEVKSTVSPKLSVDQFQSFKHEFETFIPWATEHPIAATIFLERQGLTPIVLEPTPVLNPHPSAETMAALDGAFLNLNRSGLMMNKLFKFLDRIPTMKTLDEDFVNEMVNSLSESERVRTGLKSELQGALQQFRKLRTEHEKLIKQSTALSAELAAMRRKCDSCNIATPVSSIVCNGSVPKRLKSAI